MTQASTAREAAIVSPSASRTAVARPSETRIRSTSASVRSSPPALRTIVASAVDELHAAALRHRHPAELERAGDHLGHEPRHRLVGAEPGVQHPRREQAVRLLVRERRRQPVAGGEERVARELDEPAPAELRVRLAAEREPLARPELGAEDAERDLGVRP